MMLLGRKIGMTRVYTEDGAQVPVTVIQAGPCVVTQIKTDQKDGYNAVQIGFDDIKARRSTMPLIAHDAKAGTTPKRLHREFHVDGDQIESFELGQALTVDAFADHVYVDVSGTSKGKGFQGAMKRHNFKGQLATHGVERKHRSPGSIAGHAQQAGGSGGPKKGKKMPGQMGNCRVTVRSLDVIKIDPEDNLILVKGPVPGHKNAYVEIRTPARLYTPKAERVAAAS